MKSELSVFASVPNIEIYKLNKFIYQHTILLQKSAEELKDLGERHLQPSKPNFDEISFDFMPSSFGSLPTLICTSLNGETEILLDWNQFLGMDAHLTIGNVCLSPNLRYLAITYDFVGLERFSLLILDLSTKQTIKLLESRINPEFEWNNIGDAVYVIELSESHQPYRVLRQSLQQIDCQILLEEKHSGFAIQISKSRSGRFIFCVSVSNRTSEVFYIDLEKSEVTAVLFCERVFDTRYWIEHFKDQFVILSDKNDYEFNVYFSHLIPSTKEDWFLLIERPKNSTFDGIEIFQEFLVIYGRKNGFTSAWIFQNSSTLWEVPKPERNGTIVRIEPGSFFEMHFQFGFHSTVTPYQEHKLDITNKEIVKSYSTTVLGYDPQLYKSESVWVTSDDGIKIPITLTYRNDLHMQRPVMIDVYGAYGICGEPVFKLTDLPLLDRGFVMAIAHVRGGSEFGAMWHRDGSGAKKINAITDLVLCSKFFLDHSDLYDTSKIFVRGGSAGAAIVAGALNIIPELYAGAVLQLPFIDVLGGLESPEIPLASLDFEEWGNPFLPIERELILAYSPCERVNDNVHYPPMLIQVALEDVRAPLWMSLKWLEKLKKNSQHCLLHILDGGHRQSEFQDDTTNLFALELVFIRSLSIDLSDYWINKI
jgi:oligopeptidase B